MNCERMQELLITDYIDGEADGKTLTAIRDHLAACGKCRQFEKGLAEKVVNPFKAAEKHDPPDFIWAKIKDRIIADSEIPRRRIRLVLRPAFAAAAVAVVMLAIVFLSGRVLTRHNGVNLYMADQASFVMGLDEASDDITDSPDINLGTSIEEYFLS